MYRLLSRRRRDFGGWEDDQCRKDLGSDYVSFPRTTGAGACSTGLSRPTSILPNKRYLVHKSIRVDDRYILFDLNRRNFSWIILLPEKINLAYPAPNSDIVLCTPIKFTLLDFPLGHLFDPAKACDAERPLSWRNHLNKTCDNLKYSHRSLRCCTSTVDLLERLAFVLRTML